MNGYEESVEEIDIAHYLVVFKRKFISITIISVVLMLVFSALILSRPKEYEAKCNIRISEKSNPNSLFTIRENPVESEMVVIEKKEKIINTVIAVLHNKAQGRDAFADIDNTYMNEEEIEFISRLPLNEKAKNFIRGIENESRKFSLMNKLITSVNETELFEPVPVMNTEPLTVRSFEDILDVDTLITNSDVIEVSARTQYEELSVAFANIIAVAYRADYGRGQIVEAASTKLFLEKQIAEIQEYLDEKRIELEAYAIKDITLGAPEYYQNKLSELKLELSDLEKEYTPGHEQLVRQQKRIDLVKKELTVFPQVRMMYEKLDADWKTKKAHLKKIEDLYVEAQINYDAKLLKAKEDIQIIAFAREAEIVNKTGINLIVGVILSLIIGFGQAVARDVIMNSLKTDTLELLSGSTVLAGIPVIREKWSFFVFWQKFFPSLINLFHTLRLGRRRVINSTEKVLFNYDQVSPLSEAFRSMRNNLLFAIDDKDNSKAIAVTSSIAGEGKTVNAVNLAVTMAKTGRRTVLVDADMRRPNIAQLFNLGKSTRGLSDLLIADGIKLQDVLLRSEKYVNISPWDGMMKNTVSENLMILPSGPVPHSPGDLLASEEFALLIEELKQEFEFIILDTPPGLPVSDTAVIGSLIDGVVVVYHDEFNGKFFSSLMKVFENSKTKVLGVVVNRQRKTRGTEYGYGYSNTVLSRLPFFRGKA